MKSQAGVVPGQAAGRQQPADLGLGIGDEILIDNIDDAAGKDPIPMFHQPAVEDIGLAHEGQVIGRLMTGGEDLLVAAEAGIHRISHGVEDDGIGKTEMNHPDIEVVVGHLVGDALGLGAVAPQRLDIGRAQFAEIVFAGLGGGLGMSVPSAPGCR